jgi:hypothetical protein
MAIEGPTSLNVIIAREIPPWLPVIMAIEGPLYLPIIMARERTPWLPIIMDIGLSLPAYYND